MQRDLFVRKWNARRQLLGPIHVGLQSEVSEEGKLFEDSGALSPNNSALSSFMLS